MLQGTARQRRRHAAVKKLVTVSRPVSGSLANARPALIAPLCSTRLR